MIAKKGVDETEPGDKVRPLCDDELRGFGLAIDPPRLRYPGGLKTHVLRYITPQAPIAGGNRAATGEQDMMARSGYAASAWASRSDAAASSVV